MCAVVLPQCTKDGCCWGLAASLLSTRRGLACKLLCCACAPAWRDDPDAVRGYNKCTVVGLLPSFQPPISTHPLCRTATFGNGNGRDHGQQTTIGGCRFGGDCMARTEPSLDGCTRSRGAAFPEHGRLPTSRDVQLPRPKWWTTWLGRSEYMAGSVQPSRPGQPPLAAT